MTTEVVNLYSNGNIREKYNRNSSGEKHGLYQSWWENSNKDVEYSYRDGKRDGLYQSWRENGTKSVECSYRDDKYDGQYKSWYENGRAAGTHKLQEYSFKDGKFDGLCKSWHANGRICAECLYKDGKLDGLYKSWFENGTMRAECTYRDGKIVKCISWYDDKARDCILKPSDQSVEVWKACKVNDIPVYVRLNVPPDARRVTPLLNINCKSRVEYAEVAEIIDRNGIQYNECRSFVHKGTPLIYRVGEIVKPDGFNDDPNTECAQGINVHLYKDQCDVWMDGSL